MLCYIIYYIIIIISYMMVYDDNSPYIAFSFVIGGALGNLNDRIIYGYVIDFIEVYYNTFYWPIFNIADVAISIGVILLLCNIIFNKKKIK